MKFQTDHRLVQRGIFTKHLQNKNNGDIRLTVYEALLFLNQESIGLYLVLNELSACVKNQTDQSVFRWLQLVHHCFIFSLSEPTAVKIDIMLLATKLPSVMKTSDFGTKVL